MRGLVKISLITLALLCIDEVVSQKKTLRCHVCNNAENLDCDFIHDRLSKFMVKCEDPSKTTNANCVVQRFKKGLPEGQYPFTQRMCGPVKCPSTADCCNCTKKGCNGDNTCEMLHSSASSVKLFMSLALLGSWLSMLLNF